VNESKERKKTKKNRGGRCSRTELMQQQRLCRYAKERASERVSERNTRPQRFSVGGRLKLTHSRESPLPYTTIRDLFSRLVLIGLQGYTHSTLLGKCCACVHRPQRQPTAFLGSSLLSRLHFLFVNNSLAELHLQRTSDANKINIIMCHPSKISANFFAHLTVSRGTTNLFFCFCCCI